MPKRVLQGFSLIELAIVLLVVGIMAAFLMPRWTGSGINLDAQFARLVNDIRYTQSLAETHGQHYRLVLIGTDTYQILDASGNPVPAPDTGVMTSTFVNHVTFTTTLPANLITFDNMGTPYADAAGTVALTTAPQIVLTNVLESRTLEIIPQTGIVMGVS